MSAALAIRYAFDPLDQHTIGGIAFRYVSSDRNGIVFARVDDPTIHTGFTHDKFETCRRLPDYRHERGWFHPARIKIRLRTGTTFVAHIDEAEQRIVVFRAAVCTLFLQMEAAGQASRSDRSIRKAMSVIATQITHVPNVHNLRMDGTPKRSRSGATDLRGLPGPKCLRQWLKRLREADYDSQALQTYYDNCGPRAPVIDPDLRTLALEYVTKFASQLKPSKAELYDDFVIALALVNAGRTAAGQPELVAPSNKWFNAQIRKLDAFDVYSNRHSPAAARAKFNLIGHGVDAVRPLQRIEMDEWEVSLMVLAIDAGIWETLDASQKAAVERTKCWICVAICAATRCIVGMTLSRSPSGENALATLRMVVSDKGRYADACGALTPWDMFGGIEEVVTDGGPSFVWTKFRIAIAAMRGAKHVPTSGVPFLRGRVERVFRRIHTQLIARFSGRTFENTVRRGDYDSEKQAILFVDQLRWVLCRYVVDIYHNLPHEGLGGESPRNAWHRLVREYGLVQPPDRPSLRAAFGKRMRCVLSNRGVRVLGLYYQSTSLHAHYKKVGDRKVEVRVDELDLGAVSVDVGGAFLTVPCIHDDFTDVSIGVWTRTLAELRLRHADDNRHGMKAVRETRRAIEALRENAEAFAGISPETIGEFELARLERSLAFGFVPTEPETEIDLAGDGDFDHVIEVETSPGGSMTTDDARGAVPADTGTGDVASGDRQSSPQIKSPSRYRIVD